MSFNVLTKNVTNESSIVVTRAKGIWLWDIKGNKYLDFSSQTLNLNTGNSPPFAKKAFLEQFNKYSYLSTRFTSPVLEELSRKIISISPQGFSKINLKLTNGGDANESAFKRARIFRKRPYIISLYGSHLGESAETLASSRKNFKDISIGGSNKFIYVHPPFYYRHKGYSMEKSDEFALSEIETILIKRNDICAFILEPIMVNAGGYIHSKNFLKRLRKMCTEHNVSLIFDEIQTAFGWLGTHFAAEYFHVTPDIITIGKGVGFGFPLAGIIMKKEYDVVDYGMDEFTYGGHPISCSIALAGLKYIESNHLLESVKEKEDLLRNHLLEFNNTYKNILVETRIAGLIASIEFVNTDIALEVYKLGFKSGLIMRTSMGGKLPSLVIKPPIIVKKKEITYGMNILESILKKISSK